MYNITVEYLEGPKGEFLELEDYDLREGFIIMKLGEVGYYVDTRQIIGFKVEHYKD